MAGASTRSVPASHRRRRRNRRRNRSWLPRLIVAGMAVAAALFAWAALDRHFAPASNTSRDRFDAIIVLGNPADSDGNPGPTQLARVTEAVREYERGVAPRIVVTGAAVANRFVEAQVMARTAEAQGVPADAVFMEPHARDTVQNACFATRILRQHGWTSAEIVSSPYHLPRAGLIFSRLPIAWRTHPAPSLEPASETTAFFYSALETLKTVHYLLWSRWREGCTL